jgi:hypothetical protein
MILMAWFLRASRYSGNLECEVRRIFSLVGAVSVLALMFSGVSGATPGTAAAVDPFAQGDVCSRQKQNSGECLTYAALEGVNPVIAAVRQTLEAKQLDQAKNFVGECGAGTMTARRRRRGDFLSPA